MKIALDYDRTYTLDPKFWNGIVHDADMSGHDVRIVTARHKVLDNIDHKVPCPVIYCDGVAKKFFCHHVADWNPDVWIDNKPEDINNNGPLPGLNSMSGVSRRNI